MKYLVLIIFLLSSCSAVKVDKDQEIKITKSFFGTSYTQNEQELSYTAISNFLEHDKDTKEYISKYESLTMISIPMAGIGGFFIGSSLSNGKTANLLIGTTLATVAIYMAYESENIFNQGIEVHNQKVKSKISFFPSLTNDSFAGFLNFRF